MRTRKPARTRHQRGAVIVWVAASLIVVIGMAAVVVDVGAIYDERRQLQNGSDASALAVAMDCDRGIAACGSANSTAERYLDANAKDATAARDFLCGTAATMSPCSPTPSGVAGAVGYVRVGGRTETASGGGALRYLFAPILGRDRGTVRAASTAAWGAIGNRATAPLSLSLCEFEQRGGNLVTGAFPTGTAYIRAVDTTGSTTCRTNSGATLSAGFGWLDMDGSCSTSSTAGTWVGEDPGNATPQACDPSRWLGTTVIIPVFDQTNGLGGTNGQFHIAGYVGFFVTGLRLAADGVNGVDSAAPGYPVGNICGPGGGGTSFCIRGEFRRAQVYEGEFGGGDFGARIVKLVG